MSEKHVENWCQLRYSHPDHGVMAHTVWERPPEWVVRRVNAHDELVAACQRTRDYLVMSLNKLAQTQDVAGHGAIFFVNELEAALAKAKQ